MKRGFCMEKVINIDIKDKFIEFKRGEISLSYLLDMVGQYMAYCKYIEDRNAYFEDKIPFIKESIMPVVVNEFNVCARNFSDNFYRENKILELSDIVSATDLNEVDIIGTTMLTHLIDNYRGLFDEVKEVHFNEMYAHILMLQSFKQQLPSEQLKITCFLVKHFKTKFMKVVPRKYKTNYTYEELLVRCILGDSYSNVSQLFLRHLEQPQYANFLSEQDVLMMMRIIHMAQTKITDFDNMRNRDLRKTVRKWLKFQE